MVIVSVVGAGMLGSRVAGELSMCGHKVRVWDSDNTRQWAYVALQ